MKVEKSVELGVWVEFTEALQDCLVRYIFEVALEWFTRIAEGLAEHTDKVCVGFSLVVVLFTLLWSGQLAEQTVELLRVHLVIDFKFRLRVSVQFLN